MAQPPTIAQQMAFAYAPTPFAAISFLSCSYVIYHLLVQERHKLKRLYHRLVLAMNFALLPLIFANVIGNMPVPEGTPYHVGAMGSMETCTAQGFVKFMFSFAGITYYASLILQALLGIQNNFREENYGWIEIPIHLVAYCIPCVYAIVIAVTENFNPVGTGCYYAKAPRGCESDPEVACQRGQDIKYFLNFVAFSTLFLYYIFPTSVVTVMCCWLKKKKRETSNNRGSGMTIIRDKARKEMMQSVHRQISVYLLSFWFTTVLITIHTVYRMLTGVSIYNLNILGRCIYSLQGFVFMAVYFTLQKMGGEQKREDLSNPTSTSSERRHGLTVSEIRSNAQKRSESHGEDDTAADDLKESFNFNVFDGTPDPDSPWAKFIDQGDDSDDEDVPNEGVELQCN